MSVFLSVFVAVVVGAACVWAAWWLRGQYRDFCEMRRWITAVDAESRALRAKQAKPVKKA